MPHATEDDMSLICQTGRHASCSWQLGTCQCPCHQIMSPAYAAALILRLSGQRLWPDDRETRQELADRARSADPFHPDLARALTTLGLS